MTLVEMCAKEDYNKDTEQHVRWDNLSQEERDVLIEDMRVMMFTELGEQA